MAGKKSSTLNMLVGTTGSLIVAGTSLDDVIQVKTQHPEGKLYTNVDPLVVAQFIDARAPYKMMADDQAWELVAPAIKVFYDHVSVYEAPEREPKHRMTPPDTPLAIAVNRAELLERYPHIADLPTVVELSEIVMADRYGRAPNKALFRPESIGRHWAELVNVGESHLKSLKDQYEHAMIGTGLQSGKRDETIDYARMAIDELNYVLESMEDDSPTHAPSM